MRAESASHTLTSTSGFPGSCNSLNARALSACADTFNLSLAAVPPIANFLCSLRWVEAILRLFPSERRHQSRQTDEHDQYDRKRNEYVLIRRLDAAQGCKNEGGDCRQRLPSPHRALTVTVLFTGVRSLGANVRIKVPFRSKSSTRSYFARSRTA